MGENKKDISAIFTQHAKHYLFIKTFAFSYSYIYDKHILTFLKMTDTSSMHLINYYMFASSPSSCVLLIKQRVFSRHDNTAAGDPDHILFEPCHEKRCLRGVGGGGISEQWRPGLAREVA